MTKHLELSKAIDIAFDKLLISGKEAIVEFCDILDAIVDSSLRQKHIDKAINKLTKQTDLPTTEQFKERIANAWFYLGVMYERKLVESPELTRKLEMEVTTSSDFATTGSLPVIEPVDSVELFSSDNTDPEESYAMDIANEYYLKAHKLGNRFATYRLAIRYESGIDGEHRYDIAAGFYEEAMNEELLRATAEARFEAVKTTTPVITSIPHIWLDNIGESRNKRDVISPILQMQEAEIIHQANARSTIRGIIQAIKSGHYVGIVRFANIIHSPEFAFAKQEFIDSILLEVSQLLLSSDDHIRSNAAFCRGYLFELNLTESIAKKKQLGTIEHHFQHPDSDDSSLCSDIDYSEIDGGDDPDEQLEKAIDLYKEAVSIDNNLFAMSRLMHIYQYIIKDENDYEVVTDAKKELGQLEASLRKIRNLNPKIAKLFSALDEMQVYGRKIKYLGAKPKGEMLDNHALELKIKLYDFIFKMTHPDTPADEKTMEYIEQFEQDFKKTLHAKDHEMKEHRAMWKPLVLNVLLALTGVGLAALLVKAIVVLTSSHEDNTHVFNKFGFWARTHSEALSNKVEHELDDCTSHVEWH